MTKAQLPIMSAAVLLFLFPLTRTASQTPQAQLIISTREEIGAEFQNVPCKNEERQRAVKALFERMGAPSSEIIVEKFKEVENLVVRRKGASEEKIVIGAHYDKVDLGCGAIDNWTGIVSIAHVYRAFRDLAPNKTLVFVAFGREEEGLVGSAAMAREITKDNKKQYCAMVNIDSLGMGYPQVTDENSSFKMGQLAETLAEKMKLPFSHSSFVGADSDAHSFKSKGIPTMDIHGLTSRWRSYLHSSSDSVANVRIESVYLGYRFVLAAVISIDTARCDSYR
jgi:Zn-dependent M28 family amino/carboxypeptidase